MQKSFSYERFRTQTRFKTEAQENSEMAYSVEQFIEDQENETTRKKTQQNVEKSSLSQVSECSTTTVH